MSCYPHFTQIIIIPAVVDPDAIPYVLKMTSENAVQFFLSRCTMRSRCYKEERVAGNLFMN